MAIDKHILCSEDDRETAEPEHEPPWNRGLSSEHERRRSACCAGMTVRVRQRVKVMVNLVWLCRRE
jgi:hypothetical protein